MANAVERHYGSVEGLTELIAGKYRAAGKDPSRLTTADLSPVDEFHIRGRAATLEVGARMEIGPASRVLDIGSGLGGPTRTLAETYGCDVVGVDITPAFCDAAIELSRWVGLAQKATFIQGDATSLSFEPATFDAAMTIHAAMNIAAKDRFYAGVHRVLKPGRIFAIYDVLQGEGGEVIYPVAWARDPSISHLATADEMRGLLQGAGFTIVDEIDSTEQALDWFKIEATQAASTATPPVRLRALLGGDGRVIAENQVRNLTERRVRTVTYISRS